MQRRSKLSGTGAGATKRTVTWRWTAAGNLPHPRCLPSQTSPPLRPHLPHHLRPYQLSLTVQARSQMTPRPPTRSTRAVSAEAALQPPLHHIRMPLWHPPRTWCRCSGTCWSPPRSSSSCLPGSGTGLQPLHRVILTPSDRARSKQGPRGLTSGGHCPRSWRTRTCALHSCYPLALHRAQHPAQGGPAMVVGYWMEAAAMDRQTL